MTTRKQMRERNELFQIQFEKDFKTWKRDSSRGYVRVKPTLSKAGHLKANKELLKPSTPKPDKDFWFKKLFGDKIEVKEISYQDQVEKFWINKSVISVKLKCRKERKNI